MSAFARRDNLDEYESKAGIGRQPSEDVPIKVTDKRGGYNERLGESVGKSQDDPVEKTLEEKVQECFMNPGPGRVLVMPDIFKYRGKMVIPEVAKRTGTTGTILKIGYGCQCQFWDTGKNEYRNLQVGDKVAYGTWTGTQFTFDQRPSYRVLDESEIATLLNQDHTKLVDIEA